MMKNYARTLSSFIGLQHKNNTSTYGAQIISFPFFRHQPNPKNAWQSLDIEQSLTKKRGLSGYLVTRPWITYGNCLQTTLFVEIGTCLGEPGLYHLHCHFPTRHIKKLFLQKLLVWIILIKYSSSWSQNFNTRRKFMFDRLELPRPMLSA